MTIAGSPLAFLCSPYHRGGVTRWMVDMALAWRKTGALTVFVAPRPTVPFLSAGGRPTVFDLLEERSSNKLPTVVSRDFDQRFEFGTERYRAHAYAEMVRDGVPAGVPIVVSDDAAVWAGAASVARRNPMIGVLHSDGEGYQHLATTYASAAGALVCVSTRIERSLRARLVATTTRIATVPCGTPLPLLPDRSIQRSTLRLAWVGRLTEEQKRVSDLTKIALELRLTDTPFHLDIVGDGPDMDATANGMRAAGLDKQVTFHGWLDTEAVRRVMETADVLLLPSNFEGMPVVVMEALALGCGVVASRVSGLEDLEHHPLAGQCLLVHDVGDVSTAVQHVRRLFGLDSSRRANAARALAESEFSIDVCVRRYAPIVARAAEASRLQDVSLGDATWNEFASLAVSTQRRARVWMRQRLKGEPVRPR